MPSRRVRVDGGGLVAGVGGITAQTSGVVVRVGSERMRGTMTVEAWQQARRPGDAACTVADPQLAHQRQGWCTRRTLADICKDG